MHHITYSASRVTFAQNTGDLAVGHHSARRYLPNQIVDAVAIGFVVGNAQSLKLATGELKNVNW